MGAAVINHLLPGQHTRSENDLASILLCFSVLSMELAGREVNTKIP